jgi:hypothetical protein
MPAAIILERSRVWERLSCSLPEQVRRGGRPPGCLGSIFAELDGPACVGKQQFQHVLSLCQRDRHRSKVSSHRARLGPAWRLPGSARWSARKDVVRFCCQERPLPDGLLQIVATGPKEDAVTHEAA